jgi:hypothetical protein
MQENQKFEEALASAFETSSDVSVDADRAVSSELSPEAPIPPVEPVEELGKDGGVTLEDLARELAELRAMIGQPSAPVEDLQAGPEEPRLTDAFRELYPDLSEDDIPDAVWDSVRGGLPLEAAYALYERREVLRRADAETVNRKNAMGAWGRADDGADRSFSPDEVRAMTPQEVRDNYARIIQSMKHWN